MSRNCHLRSAGLRAAAVGLALLATAPQASAQQPGGKAQAAPTVAPPAEPPGPVGIWIDHTGRGAVEIRPCQNNLCAYIVWLRDPNDKQGQPLRDGRNGDKALRNRTICGLQIMGDLKLQRDGAWDEGWIYDPEKGESFSVELRMRGPEDLQVKGYKGLKFLSETFGWKRAPVVPPRCAA